MNNATVEWRRDSGSSGVATITFGRRGAVSSVEASLDEGTVAVGEGIDLFQALVEARRVLEATGVLIACNGARRDVYPSQLLRQFSGGRSAYVIGDRHGSSVTVDIFQPADWGLVVSVDDQREAFLRWVGDPPKDYVLKWTRGG